jgi:hypothetical protein
VKEGRWSNSADSNSLKTHQNRGKTKGREKAQRTGLTGPTGSEVRECVRARARDSLTVFSVLCENRNWKSKKTMGVSHSGLAIYIKKELWKLLQKYIVQKIL